MTDTASRIACGDASGVASFLTDSRFLVPVCPDESFEGCVKSGGDVSWPVGTGAAVTADMVEALDSFLGLAGSLGQPDFPW